MSLWEEPMLEFLIAVAILNGLMLLLIPEVRRSLFGTPRSDGFMIRTDETVNPNYRRAFDVTERGARAMPSHETDRLIFTGWHWSFGWLRRPELDEDEIGYCYEDGDGTLYFTAKPAHRRALLLDCWETENGERYLAFHPIPSMSEEH